MSPTTFLSPLPPQVFAGLSELRTLNVSQNGGVTDSCVPLLAALPVLETLNLSNTDLTPAAVPSLQRLLSLTSLALYSTDIPPSAAGAIKGSLPRLLTLGLDEVV